MTEPAWAHPEPLPPACMAGTCTCPTTTDGDDQHHLPGGIPIALDDTLPPDIVLLRGVTDVYVRLDPAPLSAPEPLDAGPMVCAECGTSDAATYVVTFTGAQDDPTGRTEVCRACDDALRRDEVVAKVEELFAGGPDTVCRTTWRGGSPAGSIECVEVPMDDLRALLDDLRNHPEPRPLP